RRRLRLNRDHPVCFRAFDGGEDHGETLDIVGTGRFRRAAHADAVEEMVNTAGVALLAFPFYRGNRNIGRGANETLARAGPLGAQVFTTVPHGRAASAD